MTVDLKELTEEQHREYCRRACPRIRVTKVQGDPHGRWSILVPPGGSTLSGSSTIVRMALSLPEAMDRAVQLHKEQFLYPQMLRVTKEQRRRWIDGDWCFHF